MKSGYPAKQIYIISSRAVSFGWKSENVNLNLNFSLQFNLSVACEHKAMKRMIFFVLFDGRKANKVIEVTNIENKKLARIHLGAFDFSFKNLENNRCT